MKRRLTFPPLFILILATIIGTTSTSAGVTPEQGPSASGAGFFRFRDPTTAELELWSFSFESSANKNGQARGRAEFSNLTTQTQVVVRINCLRLDLPFAILSGSVLHSDDPNLPKHTSVIFAASDRDVLPTPGVGTITPPFVFPGKCNEGEPLTMLPVEDGDIQIQP